MRPKADRLVIGRDNNVVRVDFGRDPDPPAPRFPGAAALREVVDEINSAVDNISVSALRTVQDAQPVEYRTPAAIRGCFAGVAGAVNASPDGRRSESLFGGSSITTRRGS